jgi:hypothetical protein
MKMVMTVASPKAAGAKLGKVYKNALREARPRIAALIRERVGAEAKKHFKTLAPLYIKAIEKPSAIKMTDDGIEVTLGSKIAQALEGGASAYDMKNALLKHAKKTSKSGVAYVDVPFTHTTAGAAGTTKIPFMMKRAINKLTLNTAGTARLDQKTAGRKVKKTFYQKATDGGMSKTKQVVQHKRGLHDGLTRTKTAQGSRYSTVRRISANSDPSSWMHPGFKGSHILKNTLPKLRRDIEQIVKEAVGKTKGRG